MGSEIHGREREVAAIQVFLDRPLDRLRALVLEGDPGIGKSTVWQAAVAAASERSYQVLVSRPTESEQSMPNVVLGDLFGGLPREHFAALSPPRRSALESALLLNEPDAFVDPRALAVAVTDVTARLVGERPLVLAIDDEHWLDASSAEALTFAVRRLHRQPILLLLSRRGHVPPETSLVDAVEPEDVVRLPVGSLSVGAIHEILRSRLERTLPRPWLVRLHEISGGNPFYAIELARQKGVGAVLGMTEPVVLPPTLERLVAARLRDLDPSAHDALLLVAANGRLPLALLDAVALARQTFDGPVSARVVEIVDAVVRFTHPLLASAEYQGASDKDRRAAHRRLASAVDDPVARARHLALSAEGPDATLAGLLETAAEAARHHGMPAAAAELALHATQLTPSNAGDDRHRRARAAARAHFEAGQGDAARSIASQLVTAANAGPQRAEALLLRAEFEDFEDAVVALATLEEARAQTRLSPAMEARIRIRLAESGRFLHGRSWVERHARASLRLANRLGDDGLRSAALVLLARLSLERGDSGALVMAEQAFELASRGSEATGLKAACWAVGDVLVWTGDNERARTWLEQQMVSWQDHDEQVRWELLWALTWVEVWSGHWSLAREYASEAHDISSQYGTDPPQDHLPRALIAMYVGRLSEAVDHARRGLGLAGTKQLAYFSAVLGVCAAWAGSRTTAISHFADAEHGADLRGWDEPTFRWWRGEYAEALLQDGRIGDAERLIADWESVARRLGRVRIVAETRRCRGLVAAARGDLAAATIHLQEAVDLHQAAGDPFGRARALLAHGVVLLRVRQKRAARLALEASLAAFESLEAVSWAKVARFELGRISGRTRIEGLSPSELRVVELVVAGRTNREIAAELFLGERTVASHLTHVYAKLGIRSRTELATHPSATSAGESTAKSPTS